MVDLPAAAHLLLRRRLCDGCPQRDLIVALAAFSRQSGEPSLWILGVTALLAAMAGDNMAYTLCRKIGVERWGWMHKPKVQKALGWARYEVEKRGAVLIFTARYIPWGRVAVNYVAGTAAFPRRWLLFLDAVACLTWVADSIGIGLLASSLPWLHRNPLLSAGIPVVFAILLGIVIDHLLRWGTRAGRQRRLCCRAVRIAPTQRQPDPSEAITSVLARPVPCPGRRRVRLRRGLPLQTPWSVPVVGEMSPSLPCCLGQGAEEFCAGGFASAACLDAGAVMLGCFCVTRPRGLPLDEIRKPHPCRLPQTKPEGARSEGRRL